MATILSAGPGGYDANGPDPSFGPIDGSPTFVQRAVFIVAVSTLFWLAIVLANLIWS